MNSLCPGVENGGDGPWVTALRRMRGRTLGPLRVPTVPTVRCHAAGPGGGYVLVPPGGPSRVRGWGRLARGGRAGSDSDLTRDSSGAG
jgi:hypothetical protein